MLNASRETVGTSAVLLAENDAEDPGEARDYATRTVDLLPQAASGVVVLGGDDDVTAGNGARWDVALLASYSRDLEPGEQLWGIVASGSIAIDVLIGGR